MCALFSNDCVVVYGLCVFCCACFVCDWVVVVFGCVCVLFVMYCVMLYGVLLCVRGCCVCVWFV